MLHDDHILESIRIQHGKNSLSLGLEYIKPDKAWYCLLLACINDSFAPAPCRAEAPFLRVPSCPAHMWNGPCRPSFAALGLICHCLFTLPGCPVCPNVYVQAPQSEGISLTRRLPAHSGTKSPLQLSAPGLLNCLFTERLITQVRDDGASVGVGMALL